MSYIDYDKVEDQLEISGNPIIAFKNKYYETKDDYHCREELCFDFLNKVIDEEFPDLNEGESTVTIIQTVMNYDDEDNDNVSFKKDPDKIAYKKGKKFLKLFVDTSMKPFYNNLVNFVSDISIKHIEQKNNNIYARYVLTFKIKNKHFLSHQKMSYVLGMARVAFGAILFDNIKNMNSFVENVKDSELDYRLFKKEFYTNIICSHPVNSSSITTIRKIFKDPKIANLLFVNNNDIEESWKYDTDDDMPDSDELGFLEACGDL